MKKILWIIQSNQFTPTIYDFFNLLQRRMENLVELSFIVPETSADIMEKLSNLKPTLFKVTQRTATTSHEAYLAKREALGQNELCNGLAFRDILVTDDLGAGNAAQTILGIEPGENIGGLILQVPTPLGSSDTEERIFHAGVMWAKQNKIPVVGYELLPLDTRWSLVPSLPDGLLTRTPESQAHLKALVPHNNVWMLPWYEASIFSSVSDKFNLNGTRAAYHNRATHKIPDSRTIIYLPHNIAMIYEYQELLRAMTEYGKDLHLMFNYGEDQVRGAYTQVETIELVYKNELKRFASYSFHNMNAPWEMMLADCVIACSSCFQTGIAQEKSIPTIIYDPFVSIGGYGFKQSVNKLDLLTERLEAVIDKTKIKLEFGNLILELARISK